VYATNYFETLILNTLRGIKAAAPTSVYVGLFLTDPGETGEGTEVSYTGYKRQIITFSAPEEMEGGIGIKNAADVAFPIAPSAAGTVTHLGIFDALTGGNMYVYGAMSDGQEIEAQEAPVIVAGEAKWYLTGNMSEYFKKNVLNMLRGTALDGITPYLALYDGDPDSAGKELSGSSYARIPLSFSSPQQQSTNECKIWTTEDVSTARATELWGTWADTVIMDAKSAGNAIFFKAKSPAKLMRVGLLVTISAGGLSLAVN